MKFMNVNESWFLYDTVMISPFVSSLPHAVPGWYASFAALGADDDITFFNSRNKSIGLAYNNQDSRDQIPFALVAESISVSFIAPACSSHLGDLGQNPIRGRLDTISAFFAHELPQHSSMIFRINQDERLKCNCGMLPPGYGEIGFAMGQGDIGLTGGGGNSVTAGGWGRSHLKYRWEFATGIGIPRRATMSVHVRFVEWARTVLQAIWGPGNMEMWNYVDGAPPSNELAYLYTSFLIQVLVQGKREVQQRGEYHA